MRPFEAVSYTHLDVYKRQLHNGGRAAVADAEALTGHAGDEGLAAGGTDVYKRQARPYPARLPLAGRGARFAGKVRSDGRHDTGAGPESDFGRRMNPFHLIIKPHKKFRLWCTKVCCTSHLNNLHESL